MPKTQPPLTPASQGPRQPSAQPSKAKGIGERYTFLADFAQGGGRRLVDTDPSWRDFVVRLEAAVDGEIAGHLKGCARCRACCVFSSSQRTRDAKPAPDFSEATLGTMCRDGQNALDELVALELLHEKDKMIAAMADSLNIDSLTLDKYEGVLDHRLDPDFTSLVSCAGELDRVLRQARMREELRPVMTKLSDIIGALDEWNAIKTQFGSDSIPHKFNSTVTSKDVEHTAAQKLQTMTASAAAMASQWEQKWAPASFDEVFSLFGSPLFELYNLDLTATSTSSIAGSISPAHGPPEMPLAGIDLEEIPLCDRELEEIPKMLVSVRVRPLLAHEAGDHVSCRGLEDRRTISFASPATQRYAEPSQTLSFHSVLEGSQTDVFSHSGVKGLVQKACKGSTCTVFAYGQTGAGKTHTLFGPNDCMTQLADDEVVDAHRVLSDPCRALIDDARRAKVSGQGMLPRSIQFLFWLLRRRASPFAVRVTFMEIYNEKVFDLLGASAAELQVRQRPDSQGFCVPGLTTVECADASAVLEVVRRGVATRHTGSHSTSKDSSRAHALFSLELECGEGRLGKLIFADLAGSERVKKIQGNDQQESAMINRSLLMLSNCVSTLAQQAASSSSASSAASSFRNSKLTKVLMESLSGQSFTLLIAAVSPAKRYFDETANTLFFASKCANIKKEQAVTMSPHERQVKELKQTIDQLREELAEAQAQLATCRSATTPPPRQPEEEDPNLELAKALRQELQAERRRNQELQRELTALRLGSSPAPATTSPGSGTSPISDPDRAG